MYRRLKRGNTRQFKRANKCVSSYLATSAMCTFTVSPSHFLLMNKFSFRHWVNSTFIIREAAPCQSSVKEFELSIKILSSSHSYEDHMILYTHSNESNITYIFEAYSTGSIVDPHHIVPHQQMIPLQISWRNQFKLKTCSFPLIVEPNYGGQIRATWWVLHGELLWWMKHQRLCASCAIW